MQPISVVSGHSYACRVSSLEDMPLCILTTERFATATTSHMLILAARTIVSWFRRLRVSIARILSHRAVAREGQPGCDNGFGNGHGPRAEGR